MALRVFTLLLCFIALGTQGAHAQIASDGCGHRRRHRRGRRAIRHRADVSLRALVSTVVALIGLFGSPTIGHTGGEIGELAFVRLVDDYWQVWTRELSTGEEAQWTKSRSDKRYPRWGPGGSILFRTNNAELYEIRAPGAAERSFHPELWPVHGAAYSHDLRYVALAKQGTDTLDRSDIRRVDIVSGEQQVVTPPPNNALRFQPVWFPDGSAIAYVVSRREAGSAIARVPSNGGKSAEIVGGRALFLHPAISPDGRSLAYCANPSGDLEIHVRSLSEGTERVLTDSPGLDTHPTWSPDGRQIAFTTNRNAKLEIWTMDADGSNQRALVAQGGLARDPAWR